MYALLAVVCSFVLLSFSSSALAQQQSGIVGLWQGHLTVSGTSLRLVFNIVEKSSVLSATMDSPDQGVKGIPTSSVLVRNDSLFVAVAAAQAQFAGHIATDKTSIIGMWTQGGFSLPLTLQRKSTVETINLRKKQEPVPPYPYQERHVTYPNTEAQITLAATFTYPSEGNSFPAVVLISGSGPQDRDETLLGHKPFHVLADALTRRGIAVLRFDDRGTGQSTGNFAAATTEDFASDVRAALAWLREQPMIDTRCIGLLGHSEGGIIAPMVAAQSHDVAFVVLLAAPGIPCDELMYQQAALISKISGNSPHVIETNKRIQEKLFAAVKQSSNSTELRQHIEQCMETAAPDEKAFMQQAGITVENQVTALKSPWWRFFLTYNPYNALRATRVPVLALNGEKDLQVPAKENLEAIQKALHDGGNTAVTIRALPHLNHLFQTAETGLPTEYGTIEETFAPAALQLIGEWIEQRCTH